MRKYYKIPSLNLCLLLMILFLTQNFTTDTTTEIKQIPSIILEEICNNGIDDDGDGLIDNEDPDCCNFELEYVCDDNGTAGNPLDDTFIILLNTKNKYSFNSTYQISGDVSMNDVPYESQEQLNGAAFPVFGDSLILELADSSTMGCPGEVYYAEMPQSCSECKMKIVKIEPQACQNGQYEVEVKLRYEAIPNGVITINGIDFTIADWDADAENPATETFTLMGLPCTNNTNLMITATLPDDPSCSDSATYQASGICDIVINNLTISDCSLDRFWVDVTFNYVNSPGKLNINGCTFLPTGKSGVETFKLLHLPCATTQEQLVKLVFVDDENCKAEGIIVPPCPKPKICIPKFP